MGLYTFENWEKRFEQDISKLSDAELIAEYSALDAVFEKLEVNELNYFRFTDELFIMQRLYLAEIVKRYSLYVKENTVLPAESAYQNNSLYDLEKRYCQNCKDKLLNTGCKGCPVFARLEVLKEEAAVADDLMGCPSDVSG